MSEAGCSENGCPGYSQYGAKTIKIAVDQEDTKNDVWMQRVVAVGFVRQYYDIIRENSKKPKKGYDKQWIK